MNKEDVGERIPRQRRHNARLNNGSVATSYFGLPIADADTFAQPNGSFATSYVG